MQHYQNMKFVIPTYRLRDVPETIKAYDDNFWCNGHNTPLIIFDDSSASTHEKYYQLLENTPTYNELFYVGPSEKEEFITFLNSRLRDKKLESIVKNLFRPSYGGNRNYTLMYTLGEIMVSSDDDMRPYALIENSPESLRMNEVSRGKILKINDEGFSKKSFDILSSFIEVLGKKVSDVPKNYVTGEHLIDSAMDLETNITKGLSLENSLYLEKGVINPECIIKMAQTFRSGTNDIDALDFVEMFLVDDIQVDMNELNNVYVLVNFRPAITNKNWRMDCGVSGFDNRLGLPPFFPTRLRFEDYIFRLWIQQEKFVSAHIDSAQTHIKNNYMRNPLPAEIFNEELANLLKKKIKGSMRENSLLNISFDYEGEVTSQDTEEILERITSVHKKVIKSFEMAKDEKRKNTLKDFALNLERTFYGFEPDFFQQNVGRIVDDVVSQTKAALELWPTLIEICYFKKNRDGLPIRRIKNASIAK